MAEKSIIAGRSRFGIFLSSRQFDGYELDREIIAHLQIEAAIRLRDELTEAINAELRERRNREVTEAIRARTLEIAQQERQQWD